MPRSLGGESALVEVAQRLEVATEISISESEMIAGVSSIIVSGMKMSVYGPEMIEAQLLSGLREIVKTGEQNAGDQGVCCSGWICFFHFLSSFEPGGSSGANDLRDFDA